MVSYEEILDIFFGSHNALLDRNIYGRQYMSLLLYHDEIQKDTILKSMESWGKKLKGNLQTEVAAYSKFYLAEDYHQKYYLKRYARAMESLKQIMPEHDVFVNSTITARLNGLVDGYGSIDTIKAEIKDWSLDEGICKNLLGVLDSMRW